ncbi:MAG: RIP metalloprotease RseP [Steroidobacteraceae bacterium]
MSQTVLLDLLAFIVAFCLLVTVHEFGHFWVARRLGIKVLRFSVGFGQPLWKHVGADGTEYWIAPIPLGGYVKMLDEREGPVPADQLARSVTHRPHWQRITVLLAGPAFNIIFAVLVLTGLMFASGLNEVRPVLGQIDAHSPLGLAGLSSGDEILAVGSRAVKSQSDVELDLLEALSSSGPILIRARSSNGAVRTVQVPISGAAQRLRLTEPALMDSGLGLQFYHLPIPAKVDKVLPGEPAARAGLSRGDVIVAVNGEAVKDFSGLQKRIQAHPGDSIAIRYRRGQTEASVRLTPRSERLGTRTVGEIGVLPAVPDMPYPPWMVRHIALSLPSAFVRANVEAWNMTALQGQMVWRMLTDKVSIKNLSSPLSIAQYAGDAAAEGPSSFLSFLVLLSLALGFMNLLPIPILDGGQIVLQAIEWLKGGPLSERVQIISQQLGLALLVLLMGVALFSDISQLG